jgi:hypothetical protein
MLRFAAVAAAVALLHGALLQKTFASRPQPEPAVERPRAMLLSAAPPAPTLVTPADPVAEPVPSKPIVPRVAKAPSRRPVASQEPAPAAHNDAAEAPVLVAAAVPVDVLPAAAAAVASSPAAPGVHVPVYATRMPPSMHWAYLMRRGFLSGRGDLRWSLRDGRYEARLEGNVAGFNVLDWVSRGVVEAAGAVPERFAILRRGKETMAANFQRQAGKITYSGPSTEHPLPAGAQDRLSLLLQLPGIVAADPLRFRHTDARIVVFVTGARGDADVWTFDVLGEEQVDTPRGPVRALHLQRELREPYGPHDTRLDVWLDPARHHLPVRASLAYVSGGEPLELLLSDEDPTR